MAAFIKFDGIDGEAPVPSDDVPNVSEIVVTKQNDSAHETPFYLNLKSIDIEATASSTSGDDILIGGATSYDEGSSASPISTGDLADWRSNYGTGGMAAASYKMHRIDYTAAGSTAADGNTYQGMTAVVDGGVNMLLGDGSVRDISLRDAAFFAYDQGFLGGVTVAAGDSSEPLDAVIFAGDRYDPLDEQGIGGISIAVADIEGKGPHMLMTAGFML